MLRVNVKQSYSMGTNCYLVSNDDGYIVIDPAVDYNVVDEMTSGSLQAVLITHGHFDHVEKLQSYLDNSDVKIYGHKECLEKLQNPMTNCSAYFGDEIMFDLSERFVAVCDNEELEIVGLKVKVRENSGHTNCSVSYIIDDAMFSGDFIFKGSIGRTDLPTGSNERMKESLSKIKNIDDDYVIYPGHGNQTTLYIEKKRNPYLNV